MPTYTVTADDHAWFLRCHRAWDYGALARQHLEPVAPPPPDARRDALLAALDVHYFPGMWTWDRAVVDPLVRKAHDDAGGDDLSRRVLVELQRWAPTVDRFTPFKVQADLDVPIPEPGAADRHLAAPDGRRVRFRQRIHLAVLDDADDRCWLVEHRVVDDFADGDALVLDESGLLACWAWSDTELAFPAAGTRYTELRLDPPGLKRTEVPRSPTAVAAAATRLGRSVLTMLGTGDDPDPAPAWSHCGACAFRSPCVLQQRGEDPTALLAAGYRPAPADDLVEGRLGGQSWGIGRGARPVRF